MFKGHNPLDLLIGLAFGLFVAIGIGAHSEGLRFELGAGQCRLGPSPDGMWWRKDQEHSSRYKENGCIQVGAAYGLTDRLEIAGTYMQMGAEVNAIVVSCPDDDCTKSDRKNWARAECSNTQAVDCFNRIRGSWTVRGTLLSARYEVAKIGPFGIVPEIGAFIYRVRGVVRISPTDCNDGPSCTWLADVVQQTGYYASPEVGVFLRHKFFAVGWQYIPRTTQHTETSAGISGAAEILSFKAALPLDAMFKPL